MDIFLNKLLQDCFQANIAKYSIQIILPNIFPNALVLHFTKSKYLSLSKTIQATNLQLLPIYTLTNKFLLKNLGVLTVYVQKKTVSNFRQFQIISFTSVNEWKVYILESSIPILCKFDLKIPIS